MIFSAFFGAERVVSKCFAQTLILCVQRVLPGELFLFVVASMLTVLLTAMAIVGCFLLRRRDVDDEYGDRLLACCCGLTTL